MSESVVSTWGILRRIGGSFLAVCLVLPLLMVAELVYAPELVSNWLWDLGSKFIGGSVD